MHMKPKLSTPRLSIHNRQYSNHHTKQSRTYPHPELRYFKMLQTILQRKHLPIYKTHNTRTQTLASAHARAHTHIYPDALLGLLIPPDYSVSTYFHK